MAGFFISVSQVRADESSNFVWTPISSLPNGSPIGGYTSCVIDGKIYVLGGAGEQNASSQSNFVEIYDTKNNSWTFGESLSQARWGIAAATVNGKTIVVSGGSPIPSGSTVTEEYNPKNGETMIKSDMPNPGWGVASAVADGKMYVLGGFNWYNSGEDYNREYDPSTDAWTLKTPMPTARSWFSAETIDGKIYAIGGWNKNDAVDLPTLEVYDPNTDTWEEKTPMPIGLKRFASVVFNGRLYVIGGDQGENTWEVTYNTVQVYDPVTDSWTFGDTLPGSSANGLFSGNIAETIDNTIYVFGSSFGYKLGIAGSHPSITSGLEQLEFKDLNLITEGSLTGEGSVVFQAGITSPENNQVQLQVEVELIGTAFTNTPNATSTFVDSGETASASIQNLSAGQYHWQARAVDSEGNASPWQEFGTAGNVDFTIAKFPVIVIPGILGSQKVAGVWVIDPILHTYDNLVEALKLSDYQENETLFTFPYDWRQSNASSSLLLKQKIDEVKTACSAANPDGYDCSKVDLVAHSMGGLVARAYAESDNYQNDINQLIFLATPQQGSPKAYLGWEGGSMGKTTQDRFVNTLLSLQATLNNQKNVFDYVRNFPIQSVIELLPTDDYLLDKGSSDYRTYPNNYPINTFLENLNSQTNLNKLSSIKITNILADAGSNSTINGLRLVSQSFSNGQWANGYPEGYDNFFGDFGLIMGDGDDTVPKESNSNFLGQQDVVIENSSHMDIPTDAQKEVIKDLTGVEPTIKVNYYPAIEAMKNFLIFAIFSPADFVVTSPDGQQLGKDFANNTEINQIPNAYYSGSTDDPEFVVIPNPVDGQYKVELQGKDGGGSYHVQASYISESTTTVKDFSANIAQDQNQSFNLDCASNSPQSVVNLAPQDIVPPVITINSPSSSIKYFHSNKLKINYTVSDDFSGVASVTAAIDGNILSTTTVDLFNYPLGAHTISIRAADKAGNQAVKTVNFEIIANIDSSIFDINTAYAKKWLSKEADRNTLVLSTSALKSGLNLLAIEKTSLEKLISNTQNNQKLNAAAKKKIIDPLNKLLAANSNARQMLIKNSLSDMQKNLDKIKAKKGINQSGYDMIKADISYLISNL